MNPLPLSPVFHALRRCLTSDSPEVSCVLPLDTVQGVREGNDKRKEIPSPAREFLSHSECMFPSGTKDWRERGGGGCHAQVRQLCRPLGLRILGYLIKIDVKHNKITILPLSGKRIKLTTWLPSLPIIGLDRVAGGWTADTVEEKERWMTI